MAELTERERELVGIGRSIIARVSAAESLETRADRIVNFAHLPLVASLTTHAMRLGEATFVLFEADLKMEAMATIRSLYECAITAAWLAQSSEAPAAFVNTDATWRRALAHSAQHANSEVLREGAARWQAASAEYFDTSVGDEAKNFKQRCLALNEAGYDAYVLYRILCNYSHPSPMLSDEYVLPDESVPSGAKITMEPTAFKPEGWLSVAVSAMVWSARSLDIMLIEHPNRSFLRELARHLGIVDVLTLTPAARKAVEDANTERRRAARKGRKPRSKRGRP